MNLADCLYLLTKSRFSSIFDRHYILMLHKTPFVLPELPKPVTDYFSQLEFVQTYLSQHQLSTDECIAIREALKNMIDPLHKDWLTLLIWHLRFTLKYDRLFNQCLPLEDDLYRRTVETNQLDNHYLALCAEHTDVCFFPAYNLYTEYLLKTQRVATDSCQIALQTSMVGWIDFYCPTSAFLMLKSNRSPLKHKHHYRDSIQIVFELERHKTTTLWLTTYSSQFAIYDIKNQIKNYFHRKIQSGIIPDDYLAERIIRACREQITQYKALLGYYYLALFYLDHEYHDPDQKFNHYKQALEMLLYFKKHANSEYCFIHDTHRTSVRLEQQLNNIIGLLSKNKIMYFAQFSTPQRHSLKLLMSLFDPCSEAKAKYSTNARAILDDHQPDFDFLNPEQLLMLEKLNANTPPYPSANGVAILADDPITFRLRKRLVGIFNKLYG